MSSSKVSEVQLDFLSRHGVCFLSVQFFLRLGGLFKAHPSDRHYRYMHRRRLPRALVPRLILNP